MNEKIIFFEKDCEIFTQSFFFAGMAMSAMTITERGILTLVNSMPDLKQNAMVALMYSSGLRVSEGCGLRYEDISRKNMRIFICHGKNRSRHYAILSKTRLTSSRNTGLRLAGRQAGTSRSSPARTG